MSIDFYLNSFAFNLPLKMSTIALSNISVIRIAFLITGNHHFLCFYSVNVTYHHRKEGIKPLYFTRTLLASSF